MKLLTFSHSSNKRNDTRIKALRKKYAMMGYGIYWVILEMMREADNYYLPLKEYIYEAIAEETGKNVSFIKEIIDKCIDVELFETQEEHFYCPDMLAEMAHKEKISEIRAEAGRKTKGKQ